MNRLSAGISDQPLPDDFEDNNVPKHQDAA
jgi:hypothetical protein